MVDEAVATLGVALVGAVSGGLKWGFNLQKRIEIQEAVSIAHREDIIQRLSRIERKIDANGGSKNHAND